MSRGKWKKTLLSQKVDKKQCKKCLYRPPKGSENAVFGCFYILLTGKRRPCEPSPNCTAFKPYNRKERRELEREQMGEYNRNYVERWSDLSRKEGCLRAKL